MDWTWNPAKTTYLSLIENVARDFFFSVVHSPVVVLSKLLYIDSAARVHKSKVSEFVFFFLSLFPGEEYTLHLMMCYAI